MLEEPRIEPELIQRILWRLGQEPELIFPHARPTQTVADTPRLPLRSIRVSSERPAEDEPERGR